MLRIRIQISLKWKILTFTWTISHSCTYIFCCGKKDPFSHPPPFNLGIHRGDWLIDFLLNTLYLFLTCRYTDVLYTPLLMCPVPMLSLMYLIFSQKQRMTFIDPPSRWVGRKKIVSPWLSLFYWKSLGPFFPGFVCQDRFLPLWLSWSISFELLGTFFVVGSSSLSPPQIKCISLNYSIQTLMSVNSDLDLDSENEK